MEDKIKTIKENALQEINKVSNLMELNEIRVKYLGKKGEFTRNIAFYG